MSLPRSLLCGLLLTGSLAVTAATLRADVFSNVPEATSQGFQIVYDLSPPVNAGYRDSTPVAYTTDNSATAPSFDRVAYYLELTSGATTQWVYVSADTFQKSAKEIGLPHNVNNPVVFQQPLRNMNLVSSPGILSPSNGNNLTTGRVEMWPSNYVPNNLNGASGASDTTFDFGDCAGNTGAGYGSFQIHNVTSVAGTSTAQTLLAYNDWGNSDGTADDLGIGSNTASGGQPDWTFSANASSYTVRRLQILVRPIPAKVSFTQWPKYQQLFPRNLSTNLGTIPVAGTETLGGATAAVLRVYREGVQVGSDLVQTLTYSGGSAPFSFSPQITAERANYDVVLFIRKGGTDYLVNRAQRLVAGDAFVIQGQSNADAQVYNGSANSYRDDFVRTFGFTGDAPDIPVWGEWLQAQGDGARGQANGIGQWGLVLGNTLSNTYHVPVAILNGAYGGQPIGFFQRNNSNPLDLGTNYGQLLYRAQRAGVDAHLRAIMFYQGEAENGNGPVHEVGYIALHNSWLQDFQVEHFYVCQIHNGCGVTQTDVDLRNRQRLFADELPVETAMATNGINGHNGCHYNFVGGYEVHGMHMARLLGRDLYNSGVTANVDAPNPLRAVWGNAQKTSINLMLRNTTDPITIDSGAEANFQVAGSSVTVTAATAQPGMITLTLSGSGAGATSVAYTGSNSGGGPSVVNGGGVGLLTFSEALPQPLKVAFSAPATAATQEVSPGATVQLQATATDSEGAVSSLQLLIDGQLLAATTSGSTLSASFTPRALGLYTFTARATDSTGNVATDTRTVLVDTNTPPANVSGLQIWLKATRGITVDANGLVSAWADQSGNGNNATQSNFSLQPTLLASQFGGLPGLKFTQSLLAGTAGMPTGSYTKIVRHKISDLSQQNNLISASNSNAPGAHAVFYNGLATPRLYHASVFVTSSASIAQNSDTYLAATYDQPTKTGTLYLNGANVGAGTTANDNTDPTYQVGAFSSNFFLSGLIEEVLVYNRVLTFSEIASVQGVLNEAGLSPFQRWQADLFTTQDSSALADPDRDGLNNLLEYALGGVPTSADAAIAPHAERDANGVLVFVFDRPTGFQHVGYVVEVSTDLAAWQSGTNVTATPIISASPRGSAFERVTVGALSPYAGDPRLFYRLRVNVQ